VVDKPKNSLEQTYSLAASAVAGNDLPQVPPPPVLDPNAPLAAYWQRPVYEVAKVDAAKASPELENESVKERHRIFCLLLMSLIVRFWNGNKLGPLGRYPYRENQKLPGQDPGNTIFRYRGDLVAGPYDRNRVEWDRYIGHNIACIGVDGNGNIIDFDFNHNDVFRSSVEHAEARLVRRLFSLTDIFDSWKTGDAVPGKTRAFSLEQVTLYTSLESCAQCSGIMSLGRVKQVVYLQTDPGTYVIGNIMHNLAGRDGRNQPLSPTPVAGSVIDLPHFSQLNSAYASFYKSVLDAKQAGDKAKSFFIPPDGTAADYSPSITSFLCTDAAYSIFDAGRSEFEKMKLIYPDEQLPGIPTSFTNKQCLAEAQAFMNYANVAGFRGSPHKL
jgi:tRNA(Arg) A34 adenosine deaminase TadA